MEVQPALRRSEGSSTFSVTPKTSLNPFSPFAEILSAREIADAGDPAELETALGKRHAQRAGKMRPALAPIQARPAKGAAAAPQILEIDAEVQQVFFAGARDHAAVLAEDDVLVPGQRIGQRDAEAAGDMIVAGARRAQLIAAVPARPIALRPVGGDDHDALDHARDLRRAEPEITMPALFGHR